ncbi:uncharacterized protein [Leptinotarsa decemlineata]|uniref:uncharacterized protein n=1 Tax=Leptinotarsa decemlineata TaxID=7539 RepID=UPI003D30A4F6
MIYGLTYNQIRVLAIDYASALPECNIPVQWRANRIAGIEWLKCFMKRNKQKITLRKPESTSLARAIGFNRRSVSEFFENYTSVLTKFNFTPGQIYNIDETEVTTVLKTVRIVSTKDKKQVSQTVSAERGELTTFVGIINALGIALPPVYVFPRIRKPDDYLINAPTSSVALGNSQPQCNLPISSITVPKKTGPSSSFTSPPPTPIKIVLSSCKNKEDEPSVSSNVITPEIVRPFPRATVKKTKKTKSRKGKSRIFTTTPEKNRLEGIEKERERRKQIQCELNQKRLLKQVFPENKKAKIATKLTRKMSTSSSDSDESIVLESEEISDDFSDEENVHLITDDDDINKNDFVLVKFPLKMTVSYYVGKVIESLNLNEFQIKYLRRKVPDYKFYYPLVDDISTVDRRDLVLKLPKPNSAKTEEPLLY